MATLSLVAEQQWIDLGSVSSRTTLSTSFTATTNAKPNSWSPKKKSRRTSTFFLLVTNDEPQTNNASFLSSSTLKQFLDDFDCDEDGQSVLEWDLHKDNQILSSFYEQKRNIVLDSLNPELVPHIVITPPEPNWEDFFTPLNNRIEPQWLSSLCIPPVDVSPAKMRVSATPIIPGSNSTDHSRPKAVFSPSRFAQMVDNSSIDRLVMYHVVTSLQRKLVKATVFAASTLAATFRQRYDNAQVIHGMDKPFQWVDAAEPLLTASRYYLGTLVLDSLHPCTVPHIIINEPPPDNPWISVMNATGDQDYGFGRYLTVPASLVNLRNLPEEYDEYCSVEEGDDVLSSSSFPSSPLLETPPDEVESLFTLPLEEDEKDEADDVLMELVTIQRSGYSHWSRHSVGTGCYTSTTTIYNFDTDVCIEESEYMQEEEVDQCSNSRQLYEDDEDEDDLPDLNDEWYRAIINRTNMQL